jgi:hypothetical protein
MKALRNDRTSPAPCSLILQRRYLPADHIPQPWTVWHDHPEPHQIAWGPGRFATLEENIKDACHAYYLLSDKVEYRMVRRHNETVWEYSANIPICVKTDIKVRE